MAQILTPGYLKWDGYKFVLDNSVSGGSGMLLFSGQGYSPTADTSNWILSGGGMSGPYGDPEEIVGFKVGSAKTYTKLSARLYNLDSYEGTITISVCINTPDNVIASVDITGEDLIASTSANIYIPGGAILGILAIYSESVVETNHTITVTLS